MSSKHTFGFLADTQYADAEDGYSYDKTEKRYFRDAVAKTEALAAFFAAHDVEGIFHLGDVIDGRHPTPAVPDGFEAILSPLRKACSSGPVVALAGNHEFYSVSKFVSSGLSSDDDVSNVHAAKRNLLSHHLLGTPVDGAAENAPSPMTLLRGSYVVVPNRLRVICLDSYEISAMGGGCDADVAAANAMLEEHNPNEDKNSPLGMEGEDARWVGFGGALSDEQIGWMVAMLDEAEAAGEAVLLASHTPLHPHGANSYTNVVWNYPQIEPILEQYAASGTLRACLAGHDHGGVILPSENGLPAFITLPAILTAPPGTSVGGFIHVYDDDDGRIEFHLVELDLVAHNDDNDDDGNDNGNGNTNTNVTKRTLLL